MEIPEVKKIVTEINNLVDGFNSTLDTAEGRIGNLEERSVKIFRLNHREKKGDEKYRKQRHTRHHKKV